MKRRFLLDSGPAVDFLFQRNGISEQVEDARRRGFKVGICMPILGEIAAGLEGSQSRNQSWKVARPRLMKIDCWPYDNAAALTFGRVYAELRRIGRPMQQIDVQIAAIALNLGNCTVVTYDSDFSAIPGLSVIDWRTTP